MAALRAVARCCAHSRTSLFPKAISARCICLSIPRTEKTTHTGQQYDQGDWKQTRFIDKHKVVNPNFAQDMIAEEAPIEVTERVTSCNGGGGALGHPKVFINVYDFNFKAGTILKKTQEVSAQDKPGIHTCGYCGLRFMKKSH